MKSRILIAVGAMAVLSVAACNRADETDTMTDDATAMSAEDAATDAVASTASGDEATSGTAGTSSSTTRSAGAAASGSETMDPAQTSAMQPMGDPNAPATTREQIEITRDTLSPAGASSGPTAPQPRD